MNYTPVLLGEIDISIGEHTITITGTNNTMNIGVLCIFDAENSSGANQYHSLDSNQILNHTHSYQAQAPITNKHDKTVITYLCDCSAKYITLDFLNGYSSLTGSLSDDGINGKLSNGVIVKYDIPAKADINVKLQFAVKLPNVSNSAQTFDTSKYTVKINGSSEQLSIKNGSTYSDIGIGTNISYITFCTFDIDNDMNIEIELNHNDNNNDYCYLLFGEQVRLVYNAI